MRLSELRRNPEQNKKETLLQSLEQYKGKNVFISFQRIKKLGINPAFEYPGSPVGIYSYFLPAVFDDFERLGQVEKSLPFASERPYVFVFEVTDMSNVINVETYSEEELQDDLKRFRPIIEKKYKNYKRFLSSVYDKRNTSYPLEMLMLTIYELVEANTMKMNTSLRNLGYYGIMDNIGTGVTYGGEKIKESIFLSTKYIKIIDMFINHKPNKDDVIYFNGNPGSDPDFDMFQNVNPFAEEPIKITPPRSPSGSLRVIDPGLTEFSKNDLISQQEYDINKEYGLTIKK